MIGNRRGFKEWIMGLIDREEALSHPFANGKYDHKNANKHYISGFEDYKEWLEQLPVKEVDKNLEAVYDRGFRAGCRVVLDCISTAISDILTDIEKEEREEVKE